MKNLARNLLGSQSDAEDAVQETFLKVQRSIASFRGQSSFVTWTYRILINTCYDARRSRMRKKEVANDDSAETAQREPRAPGAHPSLRMALERALASLTREMASDFGQIGVRVNAIAPGEIDTSILSPGTEKIVEQQIPMHRLGTPDEVAKIIYVLCTETSSYVNGAEIHINGGQHV